MRNSNRHQKVANFRADFPSVVGRQITSAQRRSAGLRTGFSAVGCLTLGAFLVIGMATPEQAFADIREKRAQREQADAEKLQRKMHQEYGGSCGSGLERAGGYPPNSSSMYCRYPTTKGHVRHGKYYKWWPNGSVRVEGEFWQGKKHGVWTSYLANGRRKRQDIYYAGSRQSSNRFDENNQKVDIKNSRQRRLEKKNGPARARYSDF